MATKTLTCDTCEGVEDVHYDSMTGIAQCMSCTESAWERHYADFHAGVGRVEFADGTKP